MIKNKIKLQRKKIKGFHRIKNNISTNKIIEWNNKNDSQSGQNAVFQEPIWGYEW